MRFGLSQVKQTMACWLFSLALLTLSGMAWAESYRGKIIEVEGMGGLGRREITAQVKLYGSALSGCYPIHEAHKVQVSPEGVFELETESFCHSLTLDSFTMEMSRGGLRKWTPDTPVLVKTGNHKGYPLGEWLLLRDGSAKLQNQIATTETRPAAEPDATGSSVITMSSNSIDSQESIGLDSLRTENSESEESYLDASSEGKMETGPAIHELAELPGACCHLLFADQPAAIEIAFDEWQDRNENRAWVTISIEDMRRNGIKSTQLDRVYFLCKDTAIVPLTREYVYAESGGLFRFLLLLSEQAVDCLTQDEEQE